MARDKKPFGITPIPGVINTTDFIRLSLTVSARAEPVFVRRVIGIHWTSNVIGTVVS